MFPLLPKLVLCDRATPLTFPTNMSTIESLTQTASANPFKFGDCTSISATGKFITVPFTSLTSSIGPVNSSALTGLKRTTTVLYYPCHILIDDLFLGDRFTPTVPRNKRFGVSAGQVFVVPLSSRKRTTTVRCTMSPPLA